jgi:chromosomal replication initiator protein
MDMCDEPNPDRFDHGGSGAPPFGEAWRRCCDRLRAEVGDAVFNSWFSSLTLEAVGSGQARLSVPTRFLKSWIVTHYAGRVASALNAEVGPVGQILISVRSSAPLAPLTKSSPPECALPEKTAAKPNLSLDRAAAARPAERPPCLRLATGWPGLRSIGV